MNAEPTVPYGRTGTGKCSTDHFQLYSDNTIVKTHFRHGHNAVTPQDLIFIINDNRKMKIIRLELREKLIPRKKVMSN